MFEVQKCQDLSICHTAAFRAWPLADDTTQDLYPSQCTDMGGPTVSTPMKDVYPKVTLDICIICFSCLF